VYTETVSLQEKMKHQKISNKYWKWIIEYHSDRIPNPVYFIWLTDVSDKDEKDQILISSSQKIIAAKFKRKLIKRVLKSNIELPDSKRTKKWLNRSLKCNKLTSITLDLRGVEKEKLSKRLKLKKIVEMVNFINLFEDYEIQIHQNPTKRKPRAKALNTIWDYYYEQIFWPKLNRTNQKKYRRSKLKVNRKKLLKEFSQMIQGFEDKLDFGK